MSFFDPEIEDFFSPPTAPASPAVTMLPPAKGGNEISPAAYFEAQIELVKSELAPYESQIDEFEVQTLALTINSPDSEVAALNLVLPLDKAFKAIEKRRKEIVDTPNAFAKAVNSLAKFYLDKIDRGRQTVKSKLADYARFKALEAQKAAEAERKARAEMQAKLNAEAARLTAEAQAQGTAAPPVEAPKLPEVPPAAPIKTVRAAEGTATEVKTWTFKIIDPAAVPREYLAINETLIRKAVKDGIRGIPGVSIFEETNIRFGR